MLTQIAPAVLLLVVLATAGCAPEYSRHRGYDHDRDRARYDHDDDRDADRAWNIVRNDPCRSEEYRRYAAEHKNPERRRAFVEQLAREGCSLDQRRHY
jgi:hypothetical protein